MIPAGYYAVMRASELRARPEARMVADRPIVLFRDAEGRAAALHDRCPHRGVPLSRGRCADGGLECPYHGWRFDRAGACTHIPELTAGQTIPSRATVARVPLEERGGYLWVLVGDAARWPIATLPETSARGWRGVFHSREIAGAWTHMVENVLDGAHLPFVHQGSLDRPSRWSFDWARRFRGREAATPGELAVTMTPSGFVAGAEVVSGRGRRLGFRFRMQMPSTVTVELDDGARQIRVWVAVTPTSPGRCRVEHALWRNFLTWPPADALFLANARRILGEDAAAVEAQQPAYARDGADWEVSAARDRLPLLFRKLLRQAAAAPMEAAS